MSVSHRSICDLKTGIGKKGMSSLPSLFQISFLIALSFRVTDFAIFLFLGMSMGVGVPEVKPLVEPCGLRYACVWMRTYIVWLTDGWTPLRQCGLSCSIFRFILLPLHLWLCQSGIQSIRRAVILAGGQAGGQAGGRAGRQSVRPAGLSARSFSLLLLLPP